MAHARPLRISTLDIPMRETGHLELEVGRAVLPNGYLSRAEFALADPKPQAFTVADGIRLQVRPVDPARPGFDGSLVARPLLDGPEPVIAVLVLDVTSVTPRAVLQVRDLVVE